MQSEVSYLPNISETTRIYPIFTPSLSNCRNSNFFYQPYFCQLMNRFKNIPRISSNSFSSSQDHSINTQTNQQARSYYGSYGHGIPTTPSFYPTFDPISVLASLAFLAFLLQSFASLFDRSRSIMPTIVSSSRHSSPEIDDGLAERVMRALNEYAVLETNLINKNKESTATKLKSSTKR